MTILDIFIIICAVLIVVTSIIRAIKKVKNNDFGCDHCSGCKNANNCPSKKDN